MILFILKAKVVPVRKVSVFEIIGILIVRKFPTVSITSM